MTDSVSGTRDNSHAGIQARLAKYGENAVQAKDRENISDLPRWVKTALVMKVVDGATYKEAAGRFGKTGRTLSEYAKSPAAKKWIEELLEFVEDPIAMAKAYLSANALSITLERFVFLEAAMAAGDYKEGDRIARDLQDRMGIVAKKEKDAGAIKLTLNLGSASLEAPTVEAEWEEMDDDEK